MLSFKRRRILRGREEAVGQRLAAARALVAALREAEEALTAIKAANDKFYHSDRNAEQASLSSLRRERERGFIFHTIRELGAEAPNLAQLLDLTLPRQAAMPLCDWVEHTSKHDLLAIGGDGSEPKGD